MKRLFIATVVLLLIACQGTRKSSGMNESPDLQGHRGARGLMPENTIPAMHKAIDLGVTTLELDVVISKDHKVVVSHDVYFHHNITTTPEGKHLTKAEAESRLLYQMNYDSIARYDVGLKPHPDFPRQQKMAVAKPLLSDLIRSSEAYASDRKRTVAYNIEIKSRPSYDGSRHPEIEKFVGLVIAEIKSGGIAERTIVQSFDPRALQVIHRKYPEMNTALLIEGNDRRSLDEQLNQLGFVPQAYSPHYSLVNAELVQKCREKNMKLVPWTVNDLANMKRLLDLGVDGIISDYPDLFRRLGGDGR